MNWMRFALTVLAAGMVSSLTDWFFGGVLFHEKYKAYPEVWRRPQGGPGESQAIAWATMLGFFTCAVFAYACARLNLLTYPATLKLAAAVWLMAPLPLIVTNALWMKCHPWNAIAHALGWLAKLFVAAVAVAWILA